MDKHAVSTGSQRTDFCGRWVLGVCHHMPAGRQVSHVSPGGWCKAAEPLQVRATYQPTWRLSTRDQPCNPVVAAGSNPATQHIGFHTPPAGAGTSTMDEVC